MGRADVQIIIEAIDNASKVFEDVAGGASGMAASILKSAAGFALAEVGLDSLAAAARTAKEAFIDFNANVEQVSIGMTTMLGSAEASQAFLVQMQKFAAQTPFEFNDVKDAANRFLAFGFAARDVIPDLTAIGDAVAALGGGKEKIDRVMLALGQMQAKGRVQAEELLQLAEAGIPAYDILAQKLGLTGKQVANIGDQGIEAGVAIKALVEGMEERFGGMMEAQSKSFNGLASTFKDNMAIIAGSIGEPIFNAAKWALQGVNDLISGITSSLMDGGWYQVFQNLLPPEWFERVEKGFNVFSSVLESVMKVGQSVYNALNPLVELQNAIEGALFYLIGLVDDVFLAIAEKVANIVVLIADVVVPIVDGIGQALELAKQVIVEFSQSEVIPIFQTAWQVVADTVIGVWDAITETLKTIFQGIVDLASGIWDGIVQTWDDAVASLQPVIEKLKPVFEVMATSFLVAAGIVIVAVGAIAAAVKASVELTSSIIDGLVGVFQWLGEKANEVWTAIPGLIDAGMQMASDAIDSAATFISDAWDNIVNHASEVWDTIVGVISDAVDSVVSTIMDVISPIVDWFSETWDSIGQYLTDVWNAILKICDEVWNNIVQAISGPIITLSSWFSGAMNWFIDAATNAFNSLGQTVSDIWSNISGAIWAQVSEFVSGILQRLGPLGAIVESVAAKIGAAWNSFVGGAGSAASRFRAIFSNGGLSLKGLDDLNKHQGRPGPSWGDDGKKGHQGTGGHTKDQAAKLAKDMANVTDKIGDMFDKLNKKIYDETASTYEKGMDEITMTIDNMNRELVKMAPKLKETGVDISGLKAKMEEYRKVMTGAVERVWKENWTAMRNNTALLSAQILGDKQKQADAEYQIELAKIEKETRERKKQVGKISVPELADDQFKKLNPDDQKKYIAARQEQADILAKINNEADLKTQLAQQKRERAKRDADLQAFDFQVQHNSLLVELEGKTQSEIDVLNQRELQNKIARLDIEIEKAGANKEERIKLEKEKADALNQIYQINGRNMETAAAEGIRRMKQEVVDYAKFFTDAWDSINQSAQDHWIKMLKREESFGAGFKGILSNMLDYAYSAFAKMLYYQTIATPLQNIASNLFGMSLNGNSSNQNSNYSFKFVPKFADGGDYGSGLALVGEEGPEIINFKNPGQVYNAGQTKNILNANSQSNLQVNVNNYGNSKVDVGQPRYDVDTQKLILDVVIDGAERNINGFGRNLKYLLGGQP